MTANLLGIDYGRTNIGLALAVSSFAEPLKVLKNTASLFQQLKMLVVEHQIGIIIIGLPQGSLNQESQVFGKKVNRQLKLKVIFHDETLTSKEAASKLLHKKRQHRAQPQDAYQAAVLLQDYLDTHPPNNKK